jgi:hypothetical protein
MDGLGYISGKSCHHCFKGWGLAILATMNQHPRAHDPLDAHYNKVVDEPQQLS